MDVLASFMHDTFVERQHYPSLHDGMSLPSFVHDTFSLCFRSPTQSTRATSPMMNTFPDHLAATLGHSGQEEVGVLLEADTSSGILMSLDARS